jgi:AraC-like DNA-binding protein
LKVSEQIRQLYHPIQPTIKQSVENVMYQEITPTETLQGFIYCYWQLKTKHQLSDQFNYRVVADGCIDIFFELDNPKNSFVMGFCKKYTEFPLQNNFNYVGIRFLPTMFPQIFDLDASELSNRFESLNIIEPKTSDFIADRFNETLNMDKIKELFDQYFTLKLSDINFRIDNRLYGAIKIILENFGVVNINQDLDTGISQRQLQRLFKYYIGDTAKTFSKVVQFQNILRAKPSNQSLKANKLFYDIGYYDQAHFIKDFKNFYGVTPTKAFQR